MKNTMGHHLWPHGRVKSVLNMSSKVVTTAKGKQQAQAHDVQDTKSMFVAESTLDYMIR